MYNKVLEFRKQLSLPVGDHPQLLAPEDISFHARFMMEELSELMKAHEHHDLVDAADAIVDLVYVALGCAAHMGMPMDRLFEIVHNANMSKTLGVTKRGVKFDAVKPFGWVSPEVHITELLKRYI